MNTKFQHRNLPMLLLQSRESVMRYFRPHLKEHGLTEQQWRVIRALDQYGEMEAGKIAEICCILGPSLSGVLERMERNGLIARFRISTDQRKIIVDLTPKSKDLVAGIRKEIDKQYQLLEKVVGQQSLNSLYQLLDMISSLPDPEKNAGPEVRTRIVASRKK
jgi:homoprotocatechuate degradation regulator HpaR